LRRGGRVHQHVLGGFRVAAAEHHGVRIGGPAQRVMHQGRVELHHLVARRRRREAHIAEACLVRIPGHALRGGATAGPGQGVGECLAAGYVEHVQGGQFAAAFGGAVGQIAPVRRGPVAGDRGAAVVGVRIDQGPRRALRPGLRDQHRLRLRRRLLQVEQGAAGQHRAGARGRGDRQLLHARGERLALRHRRQRRLGVCVLRGDPLLHGRVGGVFQPAIRIRHLHAMQHAGHRVRRRRGRCGGVAAARRRGGKDQCKTTSHGVLRRQAWDRHPRLAPIARGTARAAPDFRHR